MKYFSKEELVVIDKKIRSGQIKDAKLSFKGINTKTIHRREWSYYAHLSWRLGLANYGLRLLGPLIREMRETDSLVEERAEYIACLNAIGNTEEAQWRLRIEKDKDNVWIKLYGSFVAISQWDYESAANILKSLINSKEFSRLPEYNQSVAQINWLASLIAIADWQNASSLIIRLKTDLHRPGFERLLSNLHELNLQFLVGQGKVEEARSLLSEKNIDLLQGPEKLYQLKWKTVIDLKSQANNGQFDKDNYNRLKQEAAQAGRWEILRDLDSKVAIYFKNPTFLKRVFFASPWIKYKQKILSEFGYIQTLENSFEYRMLPNDFVDFSDRSKNQRIASSYDLKNALSSQGLNLKLGKLSHRLLLALSSDLYRSHSVGSLFSRIFHGEYYNPISAPNRVHQAVKKLNAALALNHEPLFVQSSIGGYRLNTSSPIVLHLPLRSDFGKLSIQLGILYEKFHLNPFDVEDVAMCLNCHDKKAQRLLKEGVEKEVLGTSGSGRGIRYFFMSQY